MDIQELIGSLAAKPSKEGYTTRELGKLWNMGLDKVRSTVAQAIESGRMKPEKRNRANMAGVVSPTQVYVLVPVVKAKGK